GWRRRQRQPWLRLHAVQQAAAGRGLLGVLLALTFAVRLPEPLLAHELDGQQHLVEGHGLVTDGGPSELTADDDAEGARRREEDRVLAGVEGAVCPPFEDLPFLFGEVLKPKGASAWRLTYRSSAAFASSIPPFTQVSRSPTVLGL